MSLTSLPMSGDTAAAVAFFVAFFSVIARVLSCVCCRRKLRYSYHGMYIASRGRNREWRSKRQPGASGS